MGELKRLICATLVLTFLGGLGVGAWIGTLTAATRERVASVDRRLDDFKQAFPDLTATQERRIKSILFRHDEEVARIQNQITAEQFRQKRSQEKASRGRIREVLSEGQRTKYDKLTAPR